MPVFYGWLALPDLCSVAAERTGQKVLRHCKRRIDCVELYASTAPSTVIAAGLLGGKNPT